jgi:tetratricopeptide (TPR) repeat protein
MLARLYEDAGEFEEAERIFLAAKEAKPDDAAVYTSLASFYNRQGKFNKTIDALEQRAAKEANNPEAWQTIAVYYQDEARKDTRLKDAEKKDYVNKGLVAVEKALDIKPDYADAMTYKGLLLRLAANLEKDPAKQQTSSKKEMRTSQRKPVRRRRRGVKPFHSRRLIGRRTGPRFGDVTAAPIQSFHLFPVRTRIVMKKALFAACPVGRHVAVAQSTTEDDAYGVDQSKGVLPA